jgi:putative spermidine/putrescine transport system permease protein
MEAAGRSLLVTPTTPSLRRPDTPRRRWARPFGEAGWPLVLPLGFFYILFLLGPVGILGVVSLATDRTLSHFSFVQYTTFFSERLNWVILLDTLRLGLTTTITCLFLAFPLALAYTRISRRLKPLLMFLIILPQLTSAVVRTFAWIVILGREGIIDRSLIALGLAPAGLLYTTPGVVLALTQIQLPLMTLPIVAALARIDPRFEEASRSLGAGAWGTFRRITLPLTAPAIIAGSLLVFTTSISAFVTQSIIGGGRLTYMPKYIYDLALGAQNWPFAAAAVVVLLATVLIAVTVFNQLGQASLKRVEG